MTEKQQCKHEDDCPRHKAGLCGADAETVAEYALSNAEKEK